MDENLRINSKMWENKVCNDFNFNRRVSKCCICKNHNVPSDIIYRGCGCVTETFRTGFVSA